MGQRIGMGHMGHGSVPVTHWPMINMHPETVEANFYCSGRTKDKVMSDVLWGSDEYKYADKRQ